MEFQDEFRMNIRNFRINVFSNIRNSKQDFFGIRSSVQTLWIFGIPYERFFSIFGIPYKLRGYSELRANVFLNIRNSVHFLAAIQEGLEAFGNVLAAFWEWRGWGASKLIVVELPDQVCAKS